MTHASEAAQRLRAQTAEQALTEAHDLILDLNEQLFRANAAAVRMARAQRRVESLVLFGDAA